MKRVFLLIIPLLLCSLLVFHANAGVSSPTAFWRFNEGSGSIASDSSGNGINGTIANATWVDGVYGKALNYSGQNYVSIPANAKLQNFSELTISFWFFPTAYKIATYQCLFNKGWLAQGAIISYISPSITITYFAWRDSVGQKSVTWNITALNEWYFVTYTWKQNDYGRAYINATQKGNTSSLNEGLNISSSWFIGSQTAATNFLYGIIDEFRIYNYTLTQPEITALYQIELPNYVNFTLYNCQATLNGSWIDNYTAAFYNNASLMTLWAYPNGNNTFTNYTYGTSGSLLNPYNLTVTQDGNVKIVCAASMPFDVGIAVAMMGFVLGIAALAIVLSTRRHD